MTTLDLIEAIRGCRKPHWDVRHLRCQCIEKVEQYRAQERRKTLLAAANYLNAHGRGGASEGIIRRIANDSERLQKLMEAGQP